MFFWCRKRRQEAGAGAQPDYRYWFLSRKCAQACQYCWAHDGKCEKKYQYCFELCYDEEVGDHDFARICTEILIELFSPYWTSMWVYDGGHNRNFLLPNGERLGRKEDFFGAFSRYLHASEVPVPVLLEKKSKDIAVFSDGLYLPILRSYLSDLSTELPLRCLSVYGYREPFTPSEDYAVEQERRELLDWGVIARYGECRDFLTILVNVGEEFAPQTLAQTVRRVCEKYGKDLRIKEE